MERGTPYCYHSTLRNGTASPLSRTHIGRPKWKTMKMLCCESASKISASALTRNFKFSQQGIFCTARSGRPQQNGDCNISALLKPASMMRSGVVNCDIEALELTFDRWLARLDKKSKL